MKNLCPACESRNPQAPLRVRGPIGPVNKSEHGIVKEIIWYASVILLTLLQHETAVVLCYHRLFSYFHNHFSAAVEAFLIVSLLDILWLYIQFLVFRASLDKLSHVARVHAWLARIQLRRWFVRLKPYFIDDAEKTPSAAPSGFQRMVDRAGYFGMLVCAALPGPGFKEIAILMALTPRYRAHGFVVTYLGTLIKTIVTLLIYAGLSHAVEQLFHNFFQ